MKTASAKNKGRLAEKRWALLWKEVDPDAERQMLSGAGYKKGDIDTKEPVSFEVKFHATGFTKAEHALQQAEKASPYEIPVCIAFTTLAENTEPIVFLRGDYFRKLYAKAKQKELGEGVRNKSYLFKKLSQTIKEIQKEFGI